MNKNPVIYFLFKLTVFFVIVFILDYSIGTVLRYFYFKQQSGLQYRTTYSIETTEADLLIFGSSRANHHYNPDVFEKRTNLSYYNVGRDGNFIFYHSAVLKGILKRHSPKIVILDFVNREFEQNQDSYDRLSSLLPYYGHHPEMRSIIALKSELEKLKLLSNIYPYNSSMFTIAVGNLGFNKKRKSDNKGYVPLTRIWNEPIRMDTSSGSYKIDSIKVKAYNTFIQDCIQAKIKLYIVCSPYFIKSNHEDYSVLLGKDIAKKNGIEFFDFSIDSVFANSPKLFSDAIHLNESGAKFFSNMLTDSLNQITKPILR
jgi:hypothetical protein